MSAEPQPGTDAATLRRAAKTLRSQTNMGAPATYNEIAGELDEIAGRLGDGFERFHPQPEPLMPYTDECAGRAFVGRCCPRCGSACPLCEAQNTNLCPHGLCSDCPDDPKPERTVCPNCAHNPHHPMTCRVGVPPYHAANFDTAVSWTTCGCNGGGHR